MKRNNCEERIRLIKDKLAYTKDRIKRPACGVLRCNYLVPNGYYEEQWDWDGFFMGGALAHEDAAEARYLKNWALNYIALADADGRVPGCVTPLGADPRLHHMKPFLAQGIYLASKALGDFAWFRPLWGDIERIVNYRERRLWNRAYDLGVWHNGMESGADNDVAVLDYPEGSVVAADLNTFLHLEYRAMALLAAQLGETEQSVFYAARSTSIRDTMNGCLWSPESERYHNINGATGEPITCISYAAFVPLWGGIPSQDQGARTIRRFLLNREHMLSPYGFRTLSRQDPRYNNANIIKPYSNWQGPVWPIVNYLYMQGLLRYGFQAEAIDIAERISALVIADIDTSGGMHENYDAETGRPLAAPDFVSWNILVRCMLEQAVEGVNPFTLEA